MKLRFLILSLFALVFATLNSMEMNNKELNTTKTSSQTVKKARSPQEIEETSKNMKLLDEKSQAYQITPEQMQAEIQFLENLQTRVKNVHSPEVSHVNNETHVNIQGAEAHKKVHVTAKKTLEAFQEPSKTGNYLGKIVIGGLAVTAIILGWYWYQNYNSISIQSSSN